MQNCQYSVIGVEKKNTHFHFRDELFVAGLSNSKEQPVVSSTGCAGAALRDEPSSLAKISINLPERLIGNNFLSTAHFACFLL